MNESKASGIFDVAKGKVKQAVGEAFGDDSMANSGTADQVKGHAKETFGSIKDNASDMADGSTASNARTNAENVGHNVRESIASGAEKAKNSIERAVEDLKNKINH
jgi:uncharacterized protein YjbJ (UPF0337 family)